MLNLEFFHLWSFFRFFYPNVASEHGPFGLWFTSQKSCVSNNFHIVIWHSLDFSQGLDPWPNSVFYTLQPDPRMPGVLAGIRAAHGEILRGGQAIGVRLGGRAKAGPLGHWGWNGRKLRRKFPPNFDDEWDPQISMIFWVGWDHHFCMGNIWTEMTHIWGDIRHIFRHITTYHLYTFSRLSIHLPLWKITFSSNNLRILTRLEGFTVDP